MTAFFNVGVCLSLASPGFPGLNEQNLFSGQPNVYLFLHLLAYHLSSSLNHPPSVFSVTKSHPAIYPLSPPHPCQLTSVCLVSFQSCAPHCPPSSPFTQPLAHLSFTNTSLTFKHVHLPAVHLRIYPSIHPPPPLLTHPPPSGTHLPTNPTPHPPQILMHLSTHPSTRYPSIHPSTYASLNLPIHHLTMAQAFVCYNALCRLSSVRPQHGLLGSLPG